MENQSKVKYAIIRTGGKQYRVAEGETVDVELLEDQNKGKIEFADVLFMHDGQESKVASTDLKGVLVKGELVGTVMGPKITSVKYKRSHNQYRKFGHRQQYSRVKITSIGSQQEKKRG